MAASVASSDGDEAGAISDINVTPLVDVVLVILIVFMITIPAIVGTRAMKVDLPDTSAAADIAESAALPLDIWMRRDAAGEIGIYVGDRQVNLEGMKQLVKELGYTSNNQPVKVGSDKSIAYGEVIKVMDALAGMGIKMLSLDTKHIGN